MTDIRRQKQLAYQKAWREKNREHIRAVKKKWREDNREYTLAKKKAWRTANPSRVQTTRKVWRIANREHILAVQRRWYKANREHIKSYNRAYRRIYRIKWLTEPRWRIWTNLRRRALSAIARIRCGKAANTRHLFGCDSTQLQHFLEAYFTPEMTWDNYGIYWNIDHIKPCAAFDLEQPDQQHLCFHWSNLRPEIAAVNFAKCAWWNGKDHRRIAA